MENRYFRSAFRGFHRQDVVQYIEYLNQQHAAQVAELTSQLQAVSQSSDCEELRHQLDAANARCAELEAALAAKEAPENDELEAYRRAERAERMAMERAGQIYTQANAVLADATVKAEAASSDLSAMADQIQSQISSYQESIRTAKDTLQEAVAVLYSIRPEE